MRDWGRLIMNRHIAKPNPKVSNKPIICSKELLAVLLSASVVLGVSVSVSQNINSSKDNSENLHDAITGTSKVVNSGAVLKNAKVNFSLKDDNNLDTIEGLIFNYLDSLIDENLSEEVKYETMVQILEDDDLKDYIFEYVKGFYPNNIIFDREQIVGSKYDILFANPTLSQYIKEVSNMYQIPEEILTGIIVRKLSEKQINDLTMPKCCDESWYRINYLRTAHNYVTGSDDDLSRFPKTKNYVQLTGAILSNALKEYKGNLTLALMSLEVGLDNMDQVKKDLKEGRHSKITEKALKGMNEILSYSLALKNTDNLVVSYFYNQNNSKCTLMICDQNMYDLYIKKYQKIIDNLRYYMGRYYDYSNNTLSY